MRNSQESNQGSSVANVTLACSLALLLGACNKESPPQDQVPTTAPAAQNQPQAPSAIEWARGALTRNPQVELVATDANAQVFTIKNKQTGEVSAVKLNELAAAPIAQLTATPSGQASPMPEAETEAAQVAATPTQGTATNAAQDTPPATRPTATSQNSGDSSGNYTIERSEGQVRVTGPGVSIVSSGPGSEGDQQAAAQNAVEPIVCEGRRMVHLDNREIFVEGDAITVRGGCELYITNSRVVATGTGIVVQDGIVHVSNSHIEGEEGSFDADSRAKVFVRGSTFRGLPRRSELAQVQDQGGNRWR